MKKIFILTAMSLLFGIGLNAQNRGGNYNNGDRDDLYDNQDQYGQYNQGYPNGQNAQYNPYQNPNYYPNNNGYSYGNGRCGNTPRPVVVVPPSYCAPVVIAPNPYYGYNYRPRPTRHHRHYAYGRRW